MAEAAPTGRPVPDITLLLESAPDAMMIVDTAGCVVLCNSRAESLLEYAPGTLAGRPSEQLLPGLSHDIAEARRSPDGAPLRLVETEARCGDGAAVALEVALARVGKGLDTYCLATLTMRSRRGRELRLFRGLLEAAPDAMVIVDQEGVITLVNAQVEALFGYERADLVGQPVEILVPDRYAGMHMAFRSGYTHQPRTRGMGIADDLYARRKDGTEFPVEVSLAPLETEQGLVISAAVRDMSERREMQAETDRIKDEFFATVSHELRTPLTSMIGYGELMADLEELSPQARKFLSVILRGAERELRLVDDLLTLVSIQESGLTLRPEPTDLAGVVRDAVEMARVPAEDAEVTLRVELPDGPVRVDGDAQRLGQALDSLLSNAVKFTPEGGAIRVVLEQRGGQAHVDVVDTGPGIGDVDPDLLFQRLYRADDAVLQQVPGAGLGLTIALAIAEAHRGTIMVVRSDASGSTFRLELPTL